MRKFRARNRALTSLSLLLCILICVYFSYTNERTARAQAQYGQIQGIVQGQRSKKPLPSVTVTVKGPALQQYQAELTDSSGHYLLTQLPPGDGYELAFYFGTSENPLLVRPQIRLTQGATLSIDVSLPETGQAATKVIVERAQSVDVASSNTGVTIGQEMLQRLPIKGRTFESLLALAPGAADVAPRELTGAGVIGGAVGVSIAGGTGNENNYIIDGLNITDPNLGLIGTELNQNFIREVTILTGGYQAEYGRATGGIASIITKSGSDTFHGGVYGNVQPFQLEPLRVARLGEAIATQRRNNSLTYDVGFDLGGAIIKRRLWYYVGFAFTSTTSAIRRQGRGLISDASGRPRSATDFECPAYLASSSLCDGARTLALDTVDLSYQQELTLTRQLYNGIAKLQFSINPQHNITLAYMGSPSSLDTYSDVRSVELESSRFKLDKQVHDITGHYIGKLFSQKLQLDLLYGYHYQSETTTPDRPQQPQVVYNASPDSPFSLADFESVTDCQRRSIVPAGGTTPGLFNPCPITRYISGLGEISSNQLQRHQLLASATLYGQLFGLHAIKAGFDFEALQNNKTDLYTGTDLNASDPASGHRIYQTGSSGQDLQIFREFAHAGPLGEINALNTAEIFLQTRNYTAYLRDSWSPMWVPGLVVNAGIRWEAQEVYRPDGIKGVGIYDNWAPRLGLVYDFTKATKQSGRGKLFFNYGRFYESIPLDFNYRVLTPAGARVSDFSSTCDQQALQPGGRLLPIPSAGCQFGGAVYGDYTLAAVPGIRGQFVDEVSAGFSYEAGYGIVVGANYSHRNLGSVLEPISVDGGNYFLLANPGMSADPGRVQELEQEVERLRIRALSSGASPGAQVDFSNAVNQLTAYKANAALIAKPRRDYDAFTLTINKRLTDRFSIISSYTYSRTLGNYPGTFTSHNGQSTPNASVQYVFLDIQANKSGPLPTDRPHNLKLLGVYEQPLGRHGRFTTGLSFLVVSGRPIDVLGAHPLGGPRETFILPRGSGGRTPVVSQLDLHLGYSLLLRKTWTVDLAVDVFNLLNQHAVINVDDEYTASAVAPIVGGKSEDLKHLRTADNEPVVVNSNFGQPTAYQEPLYLRFGAKLGF